MMPKFVTATLHMMTVYSDGIIPQKAGIQARHTIAGAMLNLLYREFRAMWYLLISHPPQVVFLLSTQLTRYVACAL